MQISKGVSQRKSAHQNSKFAYFVNDSQYEVIYKTKILNKINKFKHKV